MALYIGLDVGTTTLSTVVLDAETGRLLARQTVAHGAHATSPEEKARGRSELDLMRLRRLVIQSLAEITTQVSPYRRLIKGIGVTGQMHGVAFLGPDAAP